MYIFFCNLCNILRSIIANSNRLRANARRSVNFELTVFSTITFNPFAIRQKSHPPCSLLDPHLLFSRSLSVPRPFVLISRGSHVSPFFASSLYLLLLFSASAREFTYTQTYSRMLALQGARRGHLFVTGPTGTPAWLVPGKRAFVRDALSKTVPAECSAALPCTNYFCAAAIADAREPLIIPTRDRAKSYATRPFFFFFFFLANSPRPILRFAYDNFASCWNVRSPRLANGKHSRSS